METAAQQEAPMEQQPATPPVALAPRPVATLAPTTTRALILAEALKEDTEQRALLAQYVEEHMAEGVDYGAIPGTPQEVEISVGGRKKKVRKNNLLKPGAEKIFDLFRCRPSYKFISREVDRESGLYAYEMRCRAVSRDTGTVLNEGVGSASSFESKYRYRNAGRICPHCAKDTIIKGREEFGGGWLCFTKKGGCGAKWSDGAPEIESQEVGKMTNPDLADVANTVLKMAKKRAQVDCAIALARCSDLFTQDLEDMRDQGEPEERPAAARRAQPQEAARTASAPPAQQPRPAAQQQKPQTPAAVNELWDKAAAEYGDDREKAWKEACVRVFGKKVPHPSKWAEAQIREVERCLFGTPPPPDAGGPDDIPF